MFKFMTAFTPNDIPATVNTLEKLSLWCGLALSKINVSQTAIEGSGSPVNVAEFGIYNVTQTNSTRCILRQSLPIEDDFAYDGGKLWEQVQELSSDALPVGFSDAV